MFGNVLAATLRNLARNRLYAAISILGLAIGMAAALLTGLYLRDELSFDHFIPGHRDLYIVISELHAQGRPPAIENAAPAAAAAWLKQDYPEVQAVTRLFSIGDVGVKRGDVEALESVDWADPNFFDVMALPALAGDPSATLHRPDGVVITRTMARKYFGQDAPLGQVLLLNRVTPLTVGAVLRDIPSNSHLRDQIFAADLNAASPTKFLDSRPFNRGGFYVEDNTFLRISSPAAAQHIAAAGRDFTRRHEALPNGKFGFDGWGELYPIRLDRLHLYPLGGTPFVDSAVQTSPAVLTSLGLIAALILIIAGINFVNLMTARASRRMVEIGVRKVAGAERKHLIGQFIGEAMIYALIALVFSVALAEIALPALRAMLDRPLAFDYWRDPALVGAGLAMALGVGLLAGAYPAFVLSGFRPVVALKGGQPVTAGGFAVREALVAAQFAILVALILSTAVVTGQTHFLMNQALKLDKARVMTMNIAPPPDPTSAPHMPVPRCRDAFIDQVRGLPGVQGAVCSDGGALDMGDNQWSFDTPTGGVASIGVAFVDYGFFDFYGLKPLAGRAFSHDHPGDQPPPAMKFNPPVVVVNQIAARMLGYARPADAVGHVIHVHGAPIASEVVGVIPDYGFDMLHAGLRPMIYFSYTPTFDTLNIRLTGRDMPRTVRSIDALWKATGSTRPPSHQFIDQYLQSVYASTIQQGRLIDGLCGIAVFIAGLGLFGLAAFTAERRIKEIGVRKAMGASTADIFRLLLWQFTRPVLLANLIAWPLAWWAMDYWLEGFAVRIALTPWLFLAATVAAVVIAWVTVSGQTWLVARERPVNALRYE